MLILIENLLKKISKHITSYKQSIFNFLKILLNRAFHLPKTNFDLGMHHINNANITDATFRFHIVKKLLGGFPDIDYQLARCYIYKKNFKKALHYLVLDEPLAIYRRHVIERKKIDHVPNEVIIEDFNYYSNFDSINTSSLSFINSILDVIVELKEVSSFSRILDLGCGRGNFARAIDNTFTHFFTIDALDISPQMVKYCKNLKNNSNEPIYNNCYIDNYYNFQINTEEKYNLVIANLCLHYTIDFTKNSSILSKFITQDGFVLLTFYSSKLENSFDYELQNFCYTENYISSHIRELGMNIVLVKYFTLHETKKLVLYVLKKN